ncbi:MAG: tyrosine-type recombinase/integrase [Psychrobacillus psychrodurans]
MRSELKEHDFLNEEELIHFLSYVKEKESMTHYTLALLLASLGLRKGEAIALRWNHIDFDNSDYYNKYSRPFR